MDDSNIDVNTAGVLFDKLHVFCNLFNLTNFSGILLPEA